MSADEGVKGELEAAEKEVAACEETIKNIDLTAIIASKKDTKGMWASVKDLQSAFSDETKWLDFANKVASKADDKASNIKTAPAAA